MHEGGFVVTGTADGQWRFHAPDGRLVPPAPALWASGALADDVDAVDVSPGPVWDGTSLDLAWALDVLYARPGACLGDQYIVAHP